MVIVLIVVFGCRYGTDIGIKFDTIPTRKKTNPYRYDLDIDTWKRSLSMISERKTWGCRGMQGVRYDTIRVHRKFDIPGFSFFVLENGDDHETVSITLPRDRTQALRCTATPVYHSPSATASPCMHSSARYALTMFELHYVRDKITANKQWLVVPDSDWLSVRARSTRIVPVSYTHLTLPTIYSV